MDFTIRDKNGKHSLLYAIRQKIVEKADAFDKLDNDKNVPFEVEDEIKLADNSVLTFSMKAMLIAYETYHKAATYTLPVQSAGTVSCDITDIHIEINIENTTMINMELSMVDIATLEKAIEDTMKWEF